MAAAPRHDDLKLHLNVLGEDHEIVALARVGPTRLVEVAKLAHAITDGVTKIAAEHAAREGERISCKEGCAACCRQIVPLAPAEAVALADCVEAMPKERREQVRARFDAIVKRLEDEGLLDRKAPRGRAALLSPKVTPEERWEDVSHRYFAMSLACPFLENEACSVYAERPSACREYLVTTPPELCARLDPALSVAPRPVRMSDALKQLSNVVLHRKDPNVPLPLALEWAKAHGRAFQKSRDGEALAMALVEQIQSCDDAKT